MCERVCARCYLLAGMHMRLSGKNGLRAVLRKHGKQKASKGLARKPVLPHSTPKRCKIRRCMLGHHTNNAMSVCMAWLGSTWGHTMPPAGHTLKQRAEHQRCGLLPHPWLCISTADCSPSHGCASALRIAPPSMAVRQHCGLLPRPWPYFNTADCSPVHGCARLLPRPARHDELMHMFYVDASSNLHTHTHTHVHPLTHGSNIAACCFFLH